MIPSWLIVLVGMVVMIFGVYRLWVFFRLRGEPTSGDAEQQKASASVRRAHLKFGVIYLALGILLVARAWYR